MKKLSLYFLLVTCFFFYEATSQDYTFKKATDDNLVIAFGSCNKQDKPQPLWDDIIAHQPDLFLFLGDNIYGDTQDMSVLAKKYEEQKQQEGYRKLQQATSIIGVWDDHDYGQNDAGKEYPEKERSQQLLLDFFDVPQESPLREREGAYSATLMEWNGVKIKILLLDTRYHRDLLVKNDRIYKPNKVGTILGEKQWKWLGEELSDSNIDLYIVASGIQFIAEDHPYEKWANFPNERKRLFDLIADKEPNGFIFLSGDRHIAEISEIEWEGLNYPLVDVTSSGLTHTWSGAAKEENQHRIGKLKAELNYGILELSLKKSGVLTLQANIRGDNQDKYLKYKMEYILNRP